MLDLPATPGSPLFSFNKPGSMSDSPKISSFRLPVRGPLFTALCVAPVLYTWAATVLDAPAQYPGFFDLANQVIRPTIGDWAPKYALIATLGIHFLESLYIATLCWNHVDSLITTVLYLISTVLFGAPMWRDLKARIGANHAKSE